jgi:hypothetical protein
MAQTVALAVAVHMATTQLQMVQAAQETRLLPAQVKVITVVQIPD